MNNKVVKFSKQTQKIFLVLKKKYFNSYQEPCYEVCQNTFYFYLILKSTDDISTLYFLLNTLNTVADVTFFFGRDASDLHNQCIKQSNNTKYTVVAVIY